VTWPLLVRFISVIRAVVSFYLPLSVVPLYVRSAGGGAGVGALLLATLAGGAGASPRRTSPDATTTRSAKSDRLYKAAREALRLTSSGVAGRHGVFRGRWVWRVATVTHPVTVSPSGGRVRNGEGEGRR
jgi:hypothetical protein